MDPSSVTTAPRYLKLRTVSSFLLSTVMSVLMPLVLFVINWVFSAFHMLWRPLQGDLPTCPAKPSMSPAKRKFVIFLPPVLPVSSWSSNLSAIILSKKMLKRVGESRHLWRIPIVVRNHSPMLCVMVDCSCRLVLETFYGSDHVVIDVVQPHGGPESCIPNSVERLLAVHEDMVKALLMFQVFFTEYSKIENLLSCAPFCSETRLFFFDDLLSLWLQSVQEDSQHDLTWMTYQADGTVVLA